MRQLPNGLWAIWIRTLNRSCSLLAATFQHTCAHITEREEEDRETEGQTELVLVFVLVFMLVVVLVVVVVVVECWEKRNLSVVMFSPKINRSVRKRMCTMFLARSSKLFNDSTFRC